MKSLREKYGKKSLLLLIFNGLIAVIAFANFAIIANETSKEFFAQWVAFIAAASFFEMLRAGLLQAGFIRLLVLSDQRFQKNLTKILPVSFVVSSLFSLLVAGGIYLVALLPLNTSFSLSLKYLPFFYFFSLPRSFLMWYLQGKRKYTEYFLVQLVTFGGTLVFLCTSQLKEQYLFEIYCLLHFITGLPLLWLFRNIQIDHYKLESGTVKTLFGFGKFSLGTQLTLNLLKNVDIYMIGYFLGATEVALYAIPLKLTEVFDIITRTLVTHIYPSFIQNYKEQKHLALRNTLSRYVAFCTLGFIVVAGILLLFSSPLLSLLGAKNPQEVWLIFLFFLLAKILDPGIRMVGVALEAINKPNTNFYRFAFMLLSNLAISFLCLWLGLPMYYLAMVNLLVGFVGLILGYWLFAKNSNVVYKSNLAAIPNVLKNIGRKLSHKRVFFTKPY